MAQSAESPHTTRRRVWRFVFGCLVVVLVVAFWPLKGYRIDRGTFLNSLGSPFLGSQRGTAPALRDKPGVFWPAQFSKTNREAKWRAVKAENSIRNAYHGLEVNFSGNVAIQGESDFVFVTRSHNFVAVVMVNESPHFPGKTPKELGSECLKALLDGIEREIPGVTTFYNPPARQVYYDRVQPFYRVRVRPFLSKHFPKTFPPEQKSLW